VRHCLFSPFFRGCLDQVIPDFILEHILASEKAVHPSPKIPGGRFSFGFFWDGPFACSSDCSLLSTPRDVNNLRLTRLAWACAITRPGSTRLICGWEVTGRSGTNRHRTTDVPVIQDVTKHGDRIVFRGGTPDKRKKTQRQKARKLTRLHEEQWKRDFDRRGW